MATVLEDRHLLTIYDVDCFNKWKLSSITEKMLQAGNRQSDENGWEWGRLYNELGICLVLTRNHIAMDSYPGVNTDIVVKTWAKPNPKTVISRYFVFENADGERLGQALSQCVLIDVASRSVVRAENYGLYIPEYDENDVPFNDCKADKIFAARYDTEKPFLTGSRRVAYGNLDYNGHMNTAQYIHFAEDFLGREFFAARKVSSLDIKYNYELRYDDTVYMSASSLKVPPVDENAMQPLSLCDNIYISGSTKNSDGSGKIEPTVHFEISIKSKSI